MARKIGVSVTHELLPTVEVDIKLDVDEMVFYAEFMGQEFSDTDGAKLRQQVYEAIEEEAIGEEKFVPVITVSLSGLHVGRSRYKGNLKQTWDETRSRRHHWELPDEIPYLREYNGRPHILYIPYSEWLYELLREASRVSDKVNDVIRKLILKQQWTAVEGFVGKIKKWSEEGLDDTGAE